MGDVFPKALGLKVLTFFCKSRKSSEADMAQREPTALNGEFRTSPSTGKAIRYKMVWN